MHGWAAITGHYQNWADASRELNVPLIVAEGGIDPSAWGYPDIFQDPSFAQDEIDTYIRAINTAHVRSILAMAAYVGLFIADRGGIYKPKVASIRRKDSGI